MTRTKRLQWLLVPQYEKVCSATSFRYVKRCCGGINMFTPRPEIRSTYLRQSSIARVAVPESAVIHSHISYPYFVFTSATVPLLNL